MLGNLHPAQRRWRDTKCKFQRIKKYRSASTEVSSHVNRSSKTYCSKKKEYVMVNDQKAILFNNEAFYAAFSCGDIAAMSCLWAETDDVSVIHPGWKPLFGREAVLSSWADIVSEGGFSSIICREPHLFLRNDYATVVCFEDINGIFLAATNVFIKQGDSWRIMHHQAAPTSGRPSKQNESSQSVN